MSAVTTHVLDTMRGEPASGVVVRLERAGEGYLELGRGTTNADGRISDFGVPSLSEGTYRLVFETGTYLEALDAPGRRHAFFPEVVVTFAADGLRPRYHVPLLLSPYSYSTYRGS
ncbi:MAG TPA: hydroxyisourate hydrolase [Streptosporangiaceae bacterium]|nr:hydroxyisourate hydrolase [Streptosporangiaceae bacterium]